MKIKKFSIVLGIVVVTMFLSGVIYAEEPWTPMMDKLDEIYEIVLDTNDKVTPAPCEGAPVARTGQIISYEPGDDGDLEMGAIIPVPRFTDNLDGTVIDNLTKLQWTKDANINAPANWSQALLDAGNCNVGNYNDWRLPNIKELLSLVDYSQIEPILPAGHPFINVQLNWYWTSTTGPEPVYSTYTAYAFRMNYAGLNLGDKAASSWYTWFVRSGE